MELVVFVLCVCVLSVLCSFSESFVQQVHAGLITDTYMSVMRLKRSLKTYGEYKLTPQLLSEVDLVARTPVNASAKTKVCICGIF